MLPLGATFGGSLVRAQTRSLSVICAGSTSWAVRQGANLSCHAKGNKKRYRKRYLFKSFANLNYAPKGSKLRERPGERAPRYAFACLSAPDPLRGPCDRGQITSATPKETKRIPEIGYPFCLAEQERFELSRRYSRPTPLAGAPLHHLSTTPHQ